MNEIPSNQELEPIQSQEYQFPYHYIPSSDGFPNFSKSWTFAPSYLAAIALVQDWLAGLTLKDRHRHMDFGCGDGGFVNALLQMNNLPPIEFEGIDYDENAIKWAKMFSKTPDCFQAGAISGLSPKTYDSGTLIEVFEHIPPQAAGEFVAAVGSALTKGAPLFVTVPSVAKPVSAKHYRHFDFLTLQDCFKDVFDVVEIYGFEKSTFLTKLLSKLSFHWRWRFESRFTNQLLISRLAAKHRKQNGCGRIAMLLTRK